MAQGNAIRGELTPEVISYTNKTVFIATTTEGGEAAHRD
jgi:hypothetical protein